MKIYLAGSVPKGDTEAKDFINWRKEYSQAITKILNTAECMDPNVPALEGDSLAVAGADCAWIQQSDVVVVNATEKLGAGTAMELVVAKYLNKPVITILPKNTHHRRSNVLFEGKSIGDWIHPFIDTFSDFIIEDISEIQTIFPQLKKAKIKSITVIDEAIEYAKKILNSQS